MRRKKIVEMIDDMMLEVGDARDRDRKEYAKKVIEVERRFETIENAVADALIMIEELERKVKKATLKVTNNALDEVKKDIEALKEAVKPTLSKMTMKDEGGSIFNEVIDEWLNGKKEEDE